MEPYQSTTPFGRRMLTLAHVANQALAKTRPPEKAVHKWTVFRTICSAKARVGVSERALAVLDALLTFHPETVLTGKDLIVWPSNQQLALRAHGMAPATLRRHIAALVDAGLIVRRDSPNGKRYARKGRGGDVELAFGFDLSPIVVRAETFGTWAEEVLAEERALKIVRERITLCRRDIAKMIATGIEEGVPTQGSGEGPATWADIHALFRGIVGRVPRTASQAELAPLADELSMLADEVLNILESHTETQNISANESQTERHKQNSNPETLIELEPVSRKDMGASVEPLPAKARLPLGVYPLGMVLDACPDLSDYAKGGISNWRDFLATVGVVRPMLGISPSAWDTAQAVMGETQAAIVVAAILQRGATISSAGGYIRDLTRRAEEGAFSVGPMLMALIGSRQRERKRA
jgi:replication initiation protein RepC